MPPRIHYYEGPEAEARFRTARQILGLSQDKAAFVVGVARNTVTLWETGRPGETTKVPVAPMRLLERLAAEASHIAVLTGEDVKAVGRRLAEQFIEEPEPRSLTEVASEYDAEAADAQREAEREWTRDIGY